jgi:single-stranded-DNA-specific exonuclease
MGHALDSLRLLLTRNKERARELAAKLSQTNEKRQEALRAALEHARGDLPPDPAKMIIVHHESYPQGVIGLVAGKLVDEFYRPSVAISETRPISKGSARSIPGFNIVEAIGSAREHLVDHGGHPMAAGFSIEHEKLPYFKNKILEYTEKNLKKDNLTPSLKIDSTLNSDLLNPKTLELVREFEPFGVGNPEPVFVTENLEVADARTVGNEGKHLRLVLHTPNHFVYDAIGFGFGKENIAIGDRLDVAYNLSEDTWRGDGRLELKIKDLRSSKKS